MPWHLLPQGVQLGTGHGLKLSYMGSKARSSARAWSFISTTFRPTDKGRPAQAGENAGYGLPAASEHSWISPRSLKTELGHPRWLLVFSLPLWPLFLVRLAGFPPRPSIRGSWACLHPFLSSGICSLGDLACSTDLFILYMGRGPTISSPVLMSLLGSGLPHSTTYLTTSLRRPKHNFCFPP